MNITSKIVEKLLKTFTIGFILLGSSASHAQYTFTHDKGISLRDLEQNEYGQWQQGTHTTKYNIYVLTDEDGTSSEKCYFSMLSGVGNHSSMTYRRWYMYSGEDYDLSNAIMAKDGNNTGAVSIGSTKKMTDTNNGNKTNGIVNLKSLNGNLNIQYVQAQLDLAQLNGKSYTLPLSIGFEGSSENINISGNNLTEPTLEHRLVWTIRDAKEMKEKLDVCKDDKYLEEYNITTPVGKRLIISPKYCYISKNKSHGILVASYATVSGYWYSRFVSNYFYTNDEGKVVRTDSTFKWRVQKKGEGSPTVINIKAGEWSDAKITDYVNNVDYNNDGTPFRPAVDVAQDSYIYYGRSLCTPGQDQEGEYIYTLSNGKINIARFNVTFKSVDKCGPIREDGTGVAIVKETELETNYRKIASQNFDFGETSHGDNAMWTTPLQWNESSYTFFYNINTNFNYQPEPVPTSSIAKWWSRYGLFSSSKYYGNGTKNINDRLYINSGGEKRGYFLFIDGAETPGVISNIDISEAACAGTHAYFSAWVYDANTSSSGDAFAPNFNFEIVGINHDGTEVNVNTYSSGTFTVNDDTRNAGMTTDIKHANVWKQVFFDYTVPSGYDFEKMYLRIVNNQISTAGNDFAIDDINIYMEEPAVSAKQTTLLCSGTSQLTLSLNYNKLKNTVFGEAPVTTQTLPVATCVADSIILSGITANSFNDFEPAIVKIQGSNMNANLTDWKRDHFMKFLLSSDKSVYKKASSFASEEEKNTYYKKYGVFLSETDDNSLTILLYLDDEDKIKVGHSYYLLFNTNGTSDDATIESDEMNVNLASFAGYSKNLLTRSCSVNALLTCIKDAAVLKIDGKVVLDAKIETCYSDAPTLIIDEYRYMKDDGEAIASNPTSATGESLKYDWFIGQNNDYVGTIDWTGLDTEKAAFELDFGSTDNITIQQIYDKPVGTNFTDTYRKNVIKNNVSVELSLFAFRADYPNANINSESDFGTITTIIGGVLTEEMIALLKKMYKDNRIMFNQISYTPSTKYKSTLDPKEETPGEYIITARPNNSTNIFNVRIDGEEYALCVRTQNITYIAIGEHPNSVLGFNNITYPDDYTKALRLGIFQMNNVLTNSSSSIKLPIKEFTVTGNNNHIVLPVKTGNDIILESYDTHDATLTTNADMETFKGGKIGEVIAFNASLRDVNNTYVTIRFTPEFANAIKEGFTINTIFYYNEADALGNTSKGCDQPIKLPMHIVAQYMTFEGSNVDENINKTNNWWNDNSWRRTEPADMYNTDTSYKTNAENTTKHSFAPMYFTNVSIEGEKTGPYLYNYSSMNIDGTYHPDYGIVSNYVEAPTPNINYDIFVSKNYSANSYTCEAFYKFPTCSQLYLKPHAELYGQENSYMDKHIIDYELTPNRWYLLSVPLNDTYAGDMYTTKETARQETFVFEDITYDAEKNNRFNPAIYQRGWDKGSATNYDINGTRNVGFFANWSHVYNDVNQSYGIGTGFSIKVSAGSEVTSSLLRFPKSDESYIYYKIDGTTTEASPTSINRNTYKGSQFNRYFNYRDGTYTFTNESSTNRLYLLGNPFSTCIDMKVLFDNNTNLERKYWLLTENGQSASVFDDYEGFISSDASVNSSTVPVGQGFFVKRIESAANPIVLSYKRGMRKPYCMANSNINNLRATKSPSSKLFITAERDGLKSNALLMSRAYANNDFDENEDAESLLDDNLKDMPIVYTIAGNQATQINIFDKAQSIPLGIYSNSNAPTNITIRGIKNFDESVILYDAQEEKSINIEEDSTTITLPGNTIGRYFITFGKPSDRLGNSDIVIASAGKGRAIVASTTNDIKNIKVYSTAGALVRSMSPMTKQTEINIEAGIYIIEANTDDCNKKAKIRVE